MRAFRPEPPTSSRPLQTFPAEKQSINFVVWPQLERCPSRPFVDRTTSPFVPSKWTRSPKGSLALFTLQYTSDPDARDTENSGLPAQSSPNTAQIWLLKSGFVCYSFFLISENNNCFTYDVSTCYLYCIVIHSRTITMLIIPNRMHNELTVARRQPLRLHSSLFKFSGVSPRRQVAACWPIHWPPTSRPGVIEPFLCLPLCCEHNCQREHKERFGFLSNGRSVDAYERLWPCKIAHLNYVDLNIGDDIEKDVKFFRV